MKKLLLLLLCVPLIFSCVKKQKDEQPEIFLRNIDIYESSYESDNELLLYLSSMEPVNGDVFNAGSLCQELSGVDHSEGFICRYTYREGIANGKSTHWEDWLHGSGSNWILQGNFINGKKQGEWLSFQHGESILSRKLKSKKTYDKGILISKECWDVTGNKIECE